MFRKTRAFRDITGSRKEETRTERGQAMRVVWWHRRKKTFFISSKNNSGFPGDLRPWHTCYDSLACVPWLGNMCAMTHWFVCHDSFICVKSVLYLCAADSSVTNRHDCASSDHCNTLQHTATHCNTLQHKPLSLRFFRSQESGITHSFMCHDSFICVKSLTCTCITDFCMGWLRLVGSLKL